MNWITGRTPTEDEVTDAGDVGFIICYSGKVESVIYDHAICMGNVSFEEEKWAIDGFFQRDITVHGFMTPPSWPDAWGEDEGGDDLK